MDTGVYSVLVMEGTGGDDVYRGSKHTSTRAQKGFWGVRRTEAFGVCACEGVVYGELVAAWV